MLSSIPKLAFYVLSKDIKSRFIISLAKTSFKQKESQRGINATSTSINKVSKRFYYN